MSKIKSLLYFLLNIFKHNFKFKLISLLTAFILWLYVTLQTPYNRIIDVPVNVDLPDSFLFDEPPANSVKIEFVGTLRDFFLFEKFGEPYINLNLSAITSGEHYVDVLPENVIYPEWIGVKTQGKSLMKISLQNLDSIYVPLEIERTSLPRSNWRIVDYIIKPDFTWIIGGRDDLGLLGGKPLFLNPNINENFGFNVKCTVHIEIPLLPTRPFSRDSFAVIEFEMDSLIVFETKLQVTLKAGSRFHVLPDSVKFFALISASYADKVKGEDILLVAEPKRNDVHSSPIEIIWPFRELAETCWVEIPRVRLIPM